MIQQGAIAVCRRRELAQEIPEQFGMEDIDLECLRDLFGIALVVGQRMVRIGNAYVGVALVAHFMAYLQGADAGQVRLVGQHLQIKQ